MFIEMSMDFVSDDELYLTLIANPFNADFDPESAEPVRYLRAEVPAEQREAEANLWEQILGSWSAPGGSIHFTEQEWGNSGFLTGEVFDQFWDTEFGSVQIIDNEIWDMTLWWGIFRYFDIIDVTADTMTLESIYNGSVEVFQRIAD